MGWGPLLGVHPVLRWVKKGSTEERKVHERRGGLSFQGGKDRQGGGDAGLIVMGRIPFKKKGGVQGKEGRLYISGDDHIVKKCKGRSASFCHFNAARQESTWEESNSDHERGRGRVSIGNIEPRAFK